MDRFIIHPPPSIKDITKSIVQRRTRTEYIDKDLESLAAKVKSDPTIDPSQFLTKYIDPSNIGIAVVAFSVHRFPFSPIPPGEGLDRWVLQYRRKIIGHAETMREFIHLADNINQLSAIYAAMPDPQKHWELMYRLALYNTYGDTGLYTAASDLKDLPLDDPKFMDTIRLGLHSSHAQNLAVLSPKDISGNPIDPDLFTRVQQSFWQEEFAVRAGNLIDLYDCGKLSDNTEILNTVNQVLQFPPLVDILPFQRLVKWQRLATTVHKAGISDIRTKDSLFRIFQVDRFHLLGVQGLAACLPSHSDSYELLFIFELCALNSQIDTFFRNHDFKSQGAWFDGWFERYPVSDSINHVWLDTKYSPEECGWHGHFFKRECDFVKDARAVGLDDADMEFLWGVDPQTPAEIPAEILIEIPASSPELDIVDRILSWIESQVDVSDAYAWAAAENTQPKPPGCFNN
ncbi:hypothetical protein ACHAPO_004423 [Fusarium lateritium]